MERTVSIALLLCCSLGCREDTRPTHMSSEDYARTNVSLMPAGAPQEQTRHQPDAPEDIKDLDPEALLDPPPLPPPPPPKKPACTCDDEGGHVADDSEFSFRDIGEWHDYVALCGRRCLHERIVTARRAGRTLSRDELQCRVDEITPCHLMEDKPNAPQRVHCNIVGGTGCTGRIVTVRDREERIAESLEKIADSLTRERPTVEGEAPP